MKLILTLATIMLTGCSTMLCTGTGTCAATGRTSNTTATGAFTPSTVSLPSGNYIIVPNYSSGGISAVIKTSRGK